MQEKVCEKCERERIYTCKGCSEGVGLSLQTLQTALLAIDWSQERVFGSLSKKYIEDAKKEIRGAIHVASNPDIKPISDGSVMDLLDAVGMSIAESEASTVDMLFKRNVPKWKIDLMLKFPFIRKIPAFKYKIRESPRQDRNGIGIKRMELVHRERVVERVDFVCGINLRA
jgi:hypothetical protein